MKRNNKIFILFAFLQLLYCAGLLIAQITSGTIQGSVYDPAGKLIPSAQITIVSNQMALSRAVVTDSNGSYAIFGLSPAKYTISVSAPGFAETTRSKIPLAVDTVLRLDFHLMVGGPHTLIDVSAPVDSLQTETASLGTGIDQSFIDTLPLNQRDFLQLAFLAPGAFPPVQGSQLSSNGGNALEVNGGREEYNNFLLDGVDNNDPYVSGYVVQPAVDSVQEFKMVTNSYDAEYGRGAAGQVNVITRSGSNDYHATTYEYLRNKVLDARNYFSGVGFVKPPYIRNQFGAAGSGPIHKDKTFFFGNTDFLRERLGLSQQSLVPTDDERNGNLSNLGVVISDPLTGMPFNKNVIPSGDISPIARDILKMYPEPNLNGSVNNYLGQPVQPTNRMQNTFRGDQKLSSSDDLTIRYTMGIVNVFQPYPVGVPEAAPGFGDYIDDHTHNAMVREQHTFGAKAVNTLLFGYNRFSRAFLPENYQTNVDALWGVSWLNVPPRDYGFPIINVSGFSQVGDNFAFPNLRHTNTYQVAESLTLVNGRSTFKVGTELRKLQLNGHLDELARGSLSFYGGISGSPISDLLLGYPSLGIQAQVDNPIRLRSTSYNAYFQDDWKVRQNLVLNLGGRYEFNTPATDPTNAMSELDLQTGNIVQVGTNGVTDSGFSPDYKNFAPRMGIAWHAVPDFVVRAGYGVFYDAGMFITGSVAYFNPPQFTLNVFFPSAAGLLTLQNPFPLSAGYAPPASLSVLSPHIITPYLQQWNFTTEADLGKRGTITLSYVGTAGAHLIRELDLNQPPLSPTGSQNNLQSRRPYPAYSSIFYVESEGASNFNALQAHFTGHISPGVSLWAAYTYSHSIDGTSAFLGDTADPNFPQNSHDLPAERGPSSFDMRQRFVGAFVINLPHGNRWSRNSEIQGIATAETGQPFTPTVSFDNSNTGNTGQQSGSDRPNLVGNPYQAGSVASNPSCTPPSGSTRTADQWFNPCALSVAPTNSYGDAGRNSLLGPKYSSIDVSLLRRFALADHAILSLEVQSFNLLNHPNFSLPAAFADQASFGVVSSANDPRELQIAARISF